MFKRIGNLIGKAVRDVTNGYQDGRTSCTDNEPLHNHHDGCPACHTANNNCQACDGEGVDFLDWTNARGGQVQFQICELCNGNGIAVKDIDYEMVSVCDNHGNSGIEYKKLN